MRRLGSFFLAAWCGVGCGPAELPRAEAVADQKPIRASPGRIELLPLDSHPAIHLVERSGDPVGAVAVAIVHDAGSETSLALLRLVQARLERAGFDEAVTHAHALGFEIGYLAARPTRAEEFVRALTTALQTPTTEAESRAALRENTNPGIAPSGVGAQAVAACTGELVLSGAAVSAAKLEAARQRASAVSNVAFGAVGEEDLLDAVASSVKGSSGWRDAAPVTDAWPASDVASFTNAPRSPASVSVALRVASSGVAIRGAQVLAQTEGVLSLKLGALPLPWRVTQVQASARPRGACLRVDLQVSDPTTPAASDVVFAARMVALELRRVAREKPNAWILADSLLAPTDPRHAAAAAAWRALSDQLPPGVPRLFAELNLPIPADERLTQRALVRPVTQPASPAALPTLRRVEAGQREFWALLASPCGTRTETEQEAGASALLLGALARKAAHEHVTLEPWISVDGIGLLAHAPRLNPYEHPAEQAARVARALGVALAGTPLSGADLAAARLQQLTYIGETPRDGWLAALKLAAPEQTAALEPFGNWNSVSQASLVSLAARRWSLLEGPLRLAVSANWDDEQNAVAEATLGDWLAPFRSDEPHCPASGSAPAALDTGSDTSAGADVRVRAGRDDAAAYVLVRLARRSELAEALVALLNRPGGWLEQALHNPELVASARAQLLGGASRAALVIEVQTFPDKASAAVEQVRALLVRLADGGLDLATLSGMTAQLSKAREARRLDPRQRLVELWALSDTASTARASTNEALSALRQALRRHSVVRTEVVAAVEPKTQPKGPGRAPTTSKSPASKLVGATQKKKATGTR